MSKLPRKPLQFGLGTLLLAVTIFGIWLGIVVNKANQQKHAVAAIEAARGVVLFDHECKPNSVERIPDAVPPGPAWLRRRIGDDYFRSARIVDLSISTPRKEQGLSNVDDEGLHVLQSLPDLQVIDLSHNRAVTDQGLVHLRSLTKLRTLVLYECKISGAGLAHLEHMPNLKVLEVSHNPLTHEGLLAIGRLQTLRNLGMSHTPITDDDLATLASLSNLKLLWLDNTAITDRGLVHLERLTALEDLWLPVGISDDAFNRLKQALPNCRIIRVRR